MALRLAEATVALVNSHSAKKRRRGEEGMARQLEHFDNLVAMFLTRAEEKGDEPFLWAKRERRVAIDQLGRGRAAGRGAGGKPEADRARSPATGSCWSARTGPNG